MGVSVYVLALDLNSSPVLGGRIGAGFAGGCASTGLGEAIILVSMKSDAATLRQRKT